MSTEPFAAPIIKVDRANRHISELKAEIDAFLSGNPYKIVAKPDTQRIKFVVRVKKPIPEPWPAIIGDAIHNLRTALDLLACDLVRLNGKSVKNVYFPFSERRDDFETMIKKRKVNRATPEVVDIIRSLKPYHGGNEALRAIHDLDITDKHSLLIPTAHFVGIPELNVLSGKTPMVTIQNSFFGPVKDDLVIMSLPRGKNVQVYKKAEASFAITFGKGQPFAEHKTVVPVLNEFSDLVKGIIKTFEAHCLGGQQSTP